LGLLCGFRCGFYLRLKRQHYQIELLTKFNITFRTRKNFHETQELAVVYLISCHFEKEELLFSKYVL
jgi:hypothetical protein